MKILLIRIDRLGDLILTLPAIKAIKEQYGNAEITMVVNRQFLKFVEQTGLVTRVFPFSCTLFLQLRKDYYDYAIDLTPASTYVSSLLLLSVHAKEKVGYAVGVRKYFLTTSVQPGEIQYERDMVLRICEKLNISIKDRKLIFPIHNKEQVQKSCHSLVPHFKEDKKIIAVHIGASAIKKRWPLKKFALVVNKLIKEKSTVIFVGTKEEKNDINELNELLTEKQVSLAGVLSIEQLGYFLSTCDLLLCNNSGPMNIGAAVGVPMVVINQISSQIRWNPINNNIVIFNGNTHDVEQKKTGKSIEINEEKVYNACKVLLNTT